MKLVEIDTVGAEATQTIFYGLPHVLRPGPLSLLVHRAAELRGNYYFVTALTERAS